MNILLNTNKHYITVYLSYITTVESIISLSAVKANLYLPKQLHSIFLIIRKKNCIMLNTPYFLHNTNIIRKYHVYTFLSQTLDSILFLCNQSTILMLRKVIIIAFHGVFSGLLVKAL